MKICPQVHQSTEKTPQGLAIIHFSMQSACVLIIGAADRCWGFTCHPTNDETAELGLWAGFLTRPARLRIRVRTIFIHL